VGIENKCAGEKLLPNRAIWCVIAAWLIYLQATAVVMVPFSGTRYALAPVPYEVFLVAGFFDF
jgi:hypothetical protein